MFSRPNIALFCMLKMTARKFFFSFCIWLFFILCFFFLVNAYGDFLAFKTNMYIFVRNANSYFLAVDGVLVLEWVFFCCYSYALRCDKRGMLLATFIFFVNYYFSFRWDQEKNMF